jgi:1-acyl-sn-glycerol-3-phosphate acyltransferase
VAGSEPRNPRAGLAFDFIAALVRPPLHLLCKRDWRGRENMPRTGGAIVVANHYSFFDPISLGHYVLAGTKRTPRFLAKAGVFKQPTLGRLFRAAGQIPVYREGRDAVLALREGIAAVERGEVIIVYPEGTMTKDPDLWPMEGKTGAARIAMRTGAPVIPIAQWGAQEVFASYSKRPQFFPRKTLKVLAGAPVDLSGLVGARPNDDTALKAATEKIMDAITGLLEELRGESAPPQRFQPDAHRTPAQAEAGPDEAVLSEAAPAGAVPTESTRPETAVPAPAQSEATAVSATVPEPAAPRAAPPGADALPGAHA